VTALGDAHLIYPMQSNVKRIMKHGKLNNYNSDDISNASTMQSESIYYLVNIDRLRKHGVESMPPPHLVVVVTDSVS